MKNETSHAKNKPLSFTDNKHGKHIKWKLFLSSHHRTHIHNKILYHHTNRTLDQKTQKDNLNCVPKLHRALVILHKFQELEQLLIAN